MNNEMPKAVEMRLRRRVQDTGRSLERSRRAIGPDNLGGFRIVDRYLNQIVAGEKFDLDVADVEHWLRQQGGFSFSKFGLKKLI